MPSGKTKAETFSAPVALRKVFERMGVTYVKLGQFIASSPTLFPKEYVLEFQKCLDATEPLEWNVIQKVIEKELGGPVNSFYDSVDKKPLASASIAQVSLLFSFLFVIYINAFNHTIPVYFCYYSSGTTIGPRGKAENG